MRGSKELAVFDEIFDESISDEAMDEDLRLPQEAENKIATLSKEIEVLLARYRDDLPNEPLIFRDDGLAYDTTAADSALRAYLMGPMYETATFLQQQAPPLTTAFTNEDEYLKIFKALLLSFHRIGKEHRNAVEELEKSIDKEDAPLTEADLEEMEAVRADIEAKMEETRVRLDEAEAKIFGLTQEMDAARAGLGTLPRASRLAQKKAERRCRESLMGDGWASSRCARVGGRPEKLPGEEDGQEYSSTH